MDTGHNWPVTLCGGQEQAVRAATPRHYKAHAAAPPLSAASDSRHSHLCPCSTQPSPILLNLHMLLLVYACQGGKLSQLLLHRACLKGPLVWS